MARFVIIKKGDTLSGIARTYDCTVDEIRKLNPEMKGDLIILGQKLLIPSAKTNTPIPPKRVKRWSFPTLPWRNYNNKYGQFLSEGYYAEVGADHNGVDVNGNGGGDTDYGDPVHPISDDGVVVGVVHLPVWGNIVKIDHGEVYASYAHLKDVYVKVGDVVDIDDTIGTIGKGANGVYLAHLHLEVEPKIPGVPMLPIGYWPARRGLSRKQVRGFIAQRYVDGIKFLKAKGAKEA